MPSAKRPVVLRLIEGDAPVFSDLIPILACEEAFEEALRFLVRFTDKRTKKRKKPVVVHSMRVAMNLLIHGYDVDVVVAGILHDLLERNPSARASIARRFGTRVARLVSAATNNKRIKDPLERYEDSINRCLKLGEEALAVRLADLIDNLDRTAELGQPGRLDKMRGKVQIMLGLTKRSMYGKSLYQELSRRARRHFRKADAMAVAARKIKTQARTAQGKKKPLSRRR